MYNNNNNNNNNNSKIIADIALFTIKRSIALYIIRSIKSTNKIMRMFIISSNLKVFRLKGSTSLHGNITFIHLTINQRKIV